MAVNFNTAYYQSNTVQNGSVQGNSTQNKVERVINPKTTVAVDKVAEQKLDNKPPLEQVLAQQQNLQNQQVVKSDKAAIELLDQQRKEQQDKQRTIYDTPNRNASKALNAYQQVAEDEKRQEFAALVGVDLYV